MISRILSIVFVQITYGQKNILSQCLKLQGLRAAKYLWRKLSGCFDKLSTGLKSLQKQRFINTLVYKPKISYN